MVQWCRTVVYGLARSLGQSDVRWFNVRTIQPYLGLLWVRDGRWCGGDIVVMALLSFITLFNPKTNVLTIEQLLAPRRRHLVAARDDASDTVRSTPPPLACAAAVDGVGMSSMSSEASATVQSPSLIYFTYAYMLNQRDRSRLLPGHNSRRSCAQ